MNSADFTYIAGMLKDRSGLIINPDKMYLLETRLGPILRENKLADLTALVAFLRKPGSNIVRDKVVDAMTTNETSFFRDMHPFDTLKKSVIPGLVERRASQKSLRIWSAACSTGQEPYSLMMMIRESFPALKDWKLQVVATDISPSVMARAREGIYSQFEVQRGLPITHLVKYFDQVGEQWQIKPDMRQAVTFRPINLLEDFSLLGTFDIVLCRNVLIYFDQPTKTRILHGIANRLTPDGALLLGGAESVLGLCDAFASLSGLRGVYSHTSNPLTKSAAAPIKPAMAVAS